MFGGLYGVQEIFSACIINHTKDASLSLLNVSPFLLDHIEKNVLKRHYTLSGFCYTYDRYPERRFLTGYDLNQVFFVSIAFPVSLGRRTKAETLYYH